MRFCFRGVFNKWGKGLKHSKFSPIVVKPPSLNQCKGLGLCRSSWPPKAMVKDLARLSRV